MGCYQLIEAIYSTLSMLGENKFTQPTCLCILAPNLTWGCRQISARWNQEIIKYYPAVQYYQSIKYTYGLLSEPAVERYLFWPECPSINVIFQKVPNDVSLLKDQTHAVSKCCWCFNDFFPFYICHRKKATKAFSHKPSNIMAVPIIVCHCLGALKERLGKGRL